MPILRLTPACKSYLWGGNRLKTEYHKQCEEEILAETWELSCHPDGPSRIAEGAFIGRTLSEYIQIKGRRVLGSNCLGFPDFPILIKLIDAEKPLSIQVHPNNTYALEREHQYGKTEMWYILEAKPGAFLYYGFRHEVSEAEFRSRILDNTLPQVLNAIPVHKGDVFYIPAGTLHAIGEGITLAEVQQNSNLTYRVCDYGRLGTDGRPRPLHIEEAIQVTKRMPVKHEYNFGGHLARNMYFTVDHLKAGQEMNCDEESFASLLILEGEGAVCCGKEKIVCRKGDSLFVPAASGYCVLQGSLQVLCTRVGTI